MSVDDAANTGRRRKGLFRRRTNANNPSQSFDEMESLGMESGSIANPHTGTRSTTSRFRLRRNREEVDTANDVGRPDVITMRARARSVDEVSFDGSYIRDCQSASGGKESRLKTLRRRLRGGSKKKPAEAEQELPNAEEIGLGDPGADEMSSLQPPSSLHHVDSFDSDNMLNHVKAVDPNVQYQRRSTRNRLGDHMMADGGFTINAKTQNNNNNGDQIVDPSLAPPMKRISFEEESGSPTMVDQEMSLPSSDFTASSNAMPQQGAGPRRDGLMEGSFVSQASYATTQTYRSMGTNVTTSERARYTGRQGNRANKKKFRVRPYHCFTEAIHMTEEEIYNDSIRPSLFCDMLKSYLVPSTKDHKKIHVKDEILEKYGSPRQDGRIGSLRCEVLGCVSLPRKSKPDICVYLIAGDAAFCTDVIQGYRSPMWPSASRRAAVFPIHHAYTRVYAGVFDVRARKNKENDLFCGRVTIDIASLRPNTEYDITFPLRASAFVYDKQKRGVLRLRFSLHWFSERAAVLSYFSSPRTLDKSSPLVHGSPTIPCADPKTFRNVAVTVHGSDLPGKYSRVAFKATVREFQLYQLNLRFMLKYLVIDAVMYEKPYISLYLFFAGMHCVITESVSKVPPYFMGFLIIMYLENYKHFVADTNYNEGYQQLTLMEVAKALLSKTGSDEKHFEPILVTKRAKKRNRRNPRTIRRIQTDSPDGHDAGEDENILVDHKEFPFSDRKAYPKFTVENALAPSGRNNGGGHTRLHGRLSVYYAQAPDADPAGGGNDSEEEDEDSSDESAGDETIMEGAGLYDQAFDLDDDDEDEIVGNQQVEVVNNQFDYEHASQYGYGDTNPSAPVSQEDSSKIRKLIHCAQNIDDSGGAAVPPQVTVKKVENLFHKHSYSLAVEKVVAPPTKEHVKSAMSSANNNQQEKLALTTEEIETEIEKKRRAYLDEFDKLLGLQAKGSNPISRMFATFLGPLMRILRIPVFIVRISFNASTWRDPYLSFWLFCSMCLTLLILMAFPWRLFFLAVTVVGLGPQNVFLRKFLQTRAKKRKEKEAEKKIEADASMSDSAHSSTYMNTPSNVRRQKSDETESSKPEPRRGFFNRKKKREKAMMIESEFFSPQDRPPFASNAFNTSANRKPLRPRSVVIPYSKLRKERIYDWPPDPTVSRATPLEFDTWSAEQIQGDFLSTKSSDEQLVRRLSTGDQAETRSSKRRPSNDNAARRRRGSL